MSGIIGYAKLEAYLHAKDLERGRKLTPSEQLANLKRALAHCDRCDRFVSHAPWKTCPHCDYSCWDEMR